MSQWYYAVGGNSKGPVPESTLRNMIVSGELSPDTLVWCDGMKDWQPVSTIPHLYQLYETEAGAETLSCTIDDAGSSITSSPDDDEIERSFTSKPIQQPTLRSAPDKTMAVVSLVTGILGFMCCLPLAIVAVVTGHMALARIKKDPEHYEGHGMAMAGLILGYIGLVFGLLYWVGTFASIAIPAFLQHTAPGAGG